MKLSVIIAVYNQEELVIRAIKSVPARDDIETLVIDDGSTDKTWINLLKFKDEHKEYKNLRLFGLDENHGVGYAKNVGLDNAIGEYIVELDSDDYFYPFVHILEKLDGTDLVYFNLKINNGSVFYLREDTKRTFCGSTKFQRREFIGDTRYKELRVGEDWFFYDELMKKNPSEEFTGEILKHYNFPREGSLIWGQK